MSEHTPTPWEGEPENWMSVNDATGEWHHSLICQVNGKKRPEADANRKRIIACVNAFHSPDGRTIATEDIGERLVWQLIDHLERTQDKLEMFIEDHEDPGADAFAVTHCNRALLSSLKIQEPGE